MPDYEGNPYATLAVLIDEALDGLATPEFTSLVSAAQESQLRYLTGAPAARSTAYFSAEYGIDASLPIYSGGLGVLAGDHLKAASDASVPLVAIGLLYHGGYFQQIIDRAGYQHEEYPRLDPELTGLQLQRMPNGTPLLISIPMETRTVQAQVWRADVGRVPLYLLDTDIDANTLASDREISWRLYGGDRDMRIRQEIVLGIGGVRTLRALGFRDLGTYHMNEGHAAFLILELMREFKEAGATYEESREHTRARAVFTTHTPVAAGHDHFDHSLLLYYLGPWWRRAVGWTDDGLVWLGGYGDFSMTELALNVTRAANAVAAKHGEVTRTMFPGRSLGSITNGVHHPTWTGPHMAALFDRVLPGWRDDAVRLRDAATLPEAEVATAHAAAKRALIDAVVARDPRSRLDASVLTLGFARRMTGYKRANLLFHDPARLAAIARDGLQVIVAGKAHPHDFQGKELIAEVIGHRNDYPVRVVFVEGYDMRIAGLLVAGVDVWLNNPRRPLEASGTSGMKALLNGVPNLSVLDGWWLEGYTGSNGWGIGQGFQEGDEDGYDADSLYGLIEHAVMPEFYDHAAAWTARMCRAIATAPGFTSQRMVTQYAAEMYTP